MLVLSRKRDEQIVITIGGAEVVLTVVSILGNRVQLGIDAPQNVIVHRKEVYDALKKEAVANET